MLSEVSNTNTAWHHLHLGSYKTELGGVVVTGGWGKRGDIGQRVHTFSYKVNKFLGSNVQDGHCVVSLDVAKGIDLRCSHHGKGNGNQRRAWRSLVCCR